MISEYKNIDLFSIIKKKQINTPVFLDKVSAGFPSPATDYMENKLDLNEYLIRHPAATFIVKASGSSMVNADIYSGDLLIVDRSVTPKSNNIVIASIFGDLTVKKLKKKEKSFFLISANDEYPSIEVKEEMECFIWGVVTYIIHETASS
ncbi:translesion error-prone DNA polymerase V autoproteolytic subunit [Alphaproteobacteria bacterium]|nr:translesion error-prone DNA polymerase V autoproteolytic subunit [Alphaproteobacteria bacterium]